MSRITLADLNGLHHLLHSSRCCLFLSVKKSVLVLHVLGGVGIVIVSKGKEGIADFDRMGDLTINIYITCIYSFPLLII